MLSLKDTKMNQKSNYAGYINPELKDQPRRIFTREEIKMMDTDEYTQNEKAIFYQMNTIGIPTNTEINNSSGVVHVRAYTKTDGTNVREHYRSYPDGYGHSSLQSFHETSPDDIITEIPDQKPANKTRITEQMNMIDGGVISGPLVGGIALDTVSSSVVAGSIIGAVTGVLGIVGGIALLTFGIIYASKHPDKVKKAGKEIYETLAETSRELSDQIAKNLPAIEKQLSSTPAGKRTVEILKDLNNFNNNNSNNPQLFYDDNSREKYKSISRDLLSESKNLLKEQELNQKALLDEISKTSDQKTYEYLMDKYSTNKSLINNQSSQINKMEHYIDNDQFEEVVKESENNVLKGNVSEYRYLGKTEQEWRDQAIQIEGTDPNVRDDITPLIIDAVIMNKINPTFGINNSILRCIAQGSAAGISQSILDMLKGLPNDIVFNILAGGIVVGGFQLAGKAFNPIYQDIIQRINTSRLSENDIIEYIEKKILEMPKTYRGKPTNPELYRKKLYTVYYSLKTNGYLVSRHSISRIAQRMEQYNISLEYIIRVLKYGDLYYDPKENNNIRYFGKIAVIIDKYTGEIVSIYYKADPKPYWVLQRRSK